MPLLAAKFSFVYSNGSRDCSIMSWPCASLHHVDVSVYSRSAIEGLVKALGPRLSSSSARCLSAFALGLDDSVAALATCPLRSLRRSPLPPILLHADLPESLRARLAMLAKRLQVASSHGLDIDRPVLRGVSWMSSKVEAFPHEASMYQLALLKAVTSQEPVVALQRILQRVLDDHLARASARHGLPWPLPFPAPLDLEKHDALAKEFRDDVLLLDKREDWRPALYPSAAAFRADIREMRGD